MSAFSENFKALGFLGSNTLVLRSEILKEVDKLEKVSGLSLGLDLKEVLSAYGGVVPPNSVVFPESCAISMPPKGDVMFEGFLGKEIYKEYINYREFIPEDCVPIMIDVVGDLVLAKCRNSKASIHFWDHESPSRGEGERTYETFCLANGIEEFVKGLAVASESLDDVKITIKFDNGLLAKARDFKKNRENGK